MDRAEAEHRDRVLRAYFDGRDWDESPEFLLARQLVREGHELLLHFPLLVDYEWEVAEGFSQLGRGDLVFSDGEGDFAVVEVKHVEGGRWGGTGRNRRTSMRKKRRKVEEQALGYALAWQLRHANPEGTRAFLFTNESGLVLLGTVVGATDDDAGFGGYAAEE